MTRSCYQSSGGSRGLDLTGKYVLGEKPRSRKRKESTSTRGHGGSNPIASHGRRGFWAQRGLVRDPHRTPPALWSEDSWLAGWLPPGTCSCQFCFPLPPPKSKLNSGDLPWLGLRGSDIKTAHSGHREWRMLSSKLSELQGDRDCGTHTPWGTLPVSTCRGWLISKEPPVSRWHPPSQGWPQGWRSGPGHFGPNKDTHEGPCRHSGHCAWLALAVRLRWSWASWTAWISSSSSFPNMFILKSLPNKYPAHEAPSPLPSGIQNCDKSDKIPGKIRLTTEGINFCSGWK